MTFTAPCLPRNRPQRQRVIARTVGQIPDADTMVERILAIHAEALESEHIDGEGWYPAANEIAHLVGAVGGYTVAQGAGIIAALSPQCSWDENVVRALAFARGDKVGAFDDALSKAKAIATGHDPATVLGGRKVRSFYSNILLNENAVTVDRHAVAVVYGRPLSDREIKILEKIGAYTYIAAAYRAAARTLGLSPATLQAIVWLAWRRLKAANDTPEEF